MKLPRISIKKLMAIVAMVAVVVAAVVRPNYGWANLLSVSYALLLLVAPLGVILRRGPRQACWIGFGLFGWAFLLFTMMVGENISYSQVRFSNMGMPYGINAPKINILVLLSFLIDTLENIDNIDNLIDLGNSMSNASNIDNFSTSVVVVSLLGLAFAGLGGRIARFLAKGGTFDPPTSTPG